MPKMTKSYIVCKDWEWVEFGDWKIGDILHPPTNNHTDNKGKQKLKK